MSFVLLAFFTILIFRQPNFYLKIRYVFPDQIQFYLVVITDDCDLRAKFCK